MHNRCCACAMYFISNALVILLDKTQLVHTMNEAYRRTATMDYEKGIGYGIIRLTDGINRRFVQNFGQVSGFLYILV